MNDNAPMVFEERSKKIQTIIMALPIAVYDLSDNEIEIIYKKLEKYMETKRRAAREVFDFMLDKG